MFLILLLISLWYQLSCDYIRGLAYAVFLCVLMPTQLRIEMPGNLPQLTVQRLILISLFVFWFGKRELRESIKSIPLLPYLKFWCIMSLISLLFTESDFVNSLKRFLDYTLEVFAFYFLIAKSLRTSDDARRVIRAALIGLVFVAAIGIVERRTGFNPVAAYLEGGPGGGPYAGIQSTFQHRILLGTALSMGLPLAFALMCWKSEAVKLSSIFLWSSATLLMAACYFTNSRGPWLASALVLAVMGFLGSKRMKKAVVLLCCIALVSLLLKPGVWKSLRQRAAETTDASSLKGGNFYYRLELWKVAWAEITKSPKRFLFGCGPGSGANRDINWELSYRGTTAGIWSWDNQWAYDLFQYGCIGFTGTLALYWAIIKARLYSCRFGPKAERDRHVGLLASQFAMAFMMTNVLIFSKQLDYLFWSLVACGYALVRQNAKKDSKGIRDSVSKPDNSENVPVGVMPLC